ncbi:hypothetical protein [Actinomadura bangladeshensis]|uniref:Uncharacterized protein n=1 Tax=Actinomadura bangladeshensis TaxID=453573 RepID=A0A4R4NBE8_9ACTN|nr:hypothetical protein [Actinomadura bangladeshensis]TDC06199.1 hypothetical protein E1284_34250 [Actinomadura bangladeshensis]
MDVEMDGGDGRGGDVQGGALAVEGGDRESPLFLYGFAGLGGRLQALVEGVQEGGGAALARYGQGQVAGSR